MQSSDNNWIGRNTGDTPAIAFSFMIRVEGIYDLPCKSVRSFQKENEFDYVQEGGQNDFVHMLRKPISKPFTFQVERYAGIDDIDPLPLGSEPILPIMLFVNNRVFPTMHAPKTYAFMGCKVISKDYGELNAEQSGLLVETTTIAYREMVCVSLPTRTFLSDPPSFSEYVAASNLEGGIDKYKYINSQGEEAEGTYSTSLSQGDDYYRARRNNEISKSLALELAAQHNMEPERDSNGKVVPDSSMPGLDRKKLSDKRGILAQKTSGAASPSAKIIQDKKAKEDKDAWVKTADDAKNKWKWDKDNPKKTVRAKTNADEKKKSDMATTADSAANKWKWDEDKPKNTLKAKTNKDEKTKTTMASTADSAENKWKWDEDKPKNTVRAKTNSNEKKKADMIKTADSSENKWNWDKNSPKNTVRAKTNSNEKKKSEMVTTADSAENKWKWDKNSPKNTVRAKTNAGEASKAAMASTADSSENKWEWNNDNPKNTVRAKTNAGEASKAAMASTADSSENKWEWDSDNPKNTVRAKTNAGEASKAAMASTADSSENKWEWNNDNPKNTVRAKTNAGEASKAAMTSTADSSENKWKWDKDNPKKTVRAKTNPGEASKSTMAEAAKANIWPPKRNAKAMAELLSSSNSENS